MKYIEPDMEVIYFNGDSLVCTLTVSDTPGGGDGDGDLPEGGFVPLP